MTITARSLRSLLLTALIAGFIAGCAGVPLTSALRIARLDPFETDFSQVEVAARIQEVFEIKPGGATLTLKAGSTALEEEREETFVLDITDAAGSPFLVKRSKRGFHIRRFAVPEEDRARAQNFQSYVNDLRARTPEGTGSFSINADVNGICTTDAEAASSTPPRLTVYVKMSEASDFFTLLKERDQPLWEEGEDASDPATLSCEAIDGEPGPEWPGDAQEGAL